MKKNILVLTGFSGTGKTTVGRKLANNLRWKFLDIDEELTKDTGQAIKQIFADLGESGFRDLEHNKLLEAVAEDNLVISTGGGILTEPKNLHLMSATGLFVCMIIAYPSYLESHAIGVDCNSNQKHIYDCEERRVLEYTVDNLDVCSGPTSKFYSIAHIGEIIDY